MVNSRKKMRIGVSLGLYSSSWKPCTDFAFLLRTLPQKSITSGRHFKRKWGLPLSWNHFFFCSPQPYAVPSYKTVEGPSLDHSSLIEQKTLTLMQSLILPSNAQPATLVLAPNCLIKNVCRLGRWDRGIKVSARGVPIKLKGGFGHFCLHLKCP